jgi:subtilisin family serine protease
MKKMIYILFLVSTFAYSQEDAWVYFTDKPLTQFYLDNPLEMLSQKALDRRAAQGIALDDKDVPVHQPYIQQVDDAPGITVMAKSKWLNAVHIRGTVADINALAGLPFVADVDFADNSLDENTDRRNTGKKKLNPVNKIQQATVDFDYGQAANQVQMLNGHLLHQQNYTGEGMVIAVLDAGFPGVDNALPFQRLHDNELILGGYDFVHRNENFYTGGNHGTMVLSTIAAYAEGQIIGTAPDAFYYLFITEDITGENPVEESYWVEAAETADSLGVDVINTSLGYFIYDDPSYSYTYHDIDGETAFITRGANIAFTRGMLIVNSGGNSAATPNPHITVPADAFNTLTVGAVNATEQYAAFSSVGPTFDNRVKPDIVAQGAGTVVVNQLGNVTTANGTSVSSPIIAGLAACLWQALPDKTNAEIVQLIKQSSDRFNNPDAQFGYGIPDFALALANGLGIEELQRQSVMLYPNPAHETATITLPEAITGAVITFYNNLGQVVLQKEISASKPSFSVGQLSNGMYIYSIQTGEQVFNGKLIKE